MLKLLQHFYCSLFAFDFMSNKNQVSRSLLIQIVIFSFLSTTHSFYRPYCKSSKLNAEFNNAYPSHVGKSPEFYRRGRLFGSLQSSRAQTSGRNSSELLTPKAIEIYSQRDDSDLTTDAISEEIVSADVSFVKILVPSGSSQISSILNLPINGDGGCSVAVDDSESLKNHKSHIGGIDGGSLSGDFLNSDQFGDVFRQCAPYIAMHRNSIIVIHIASHLFSDRKGFDAVFEDISILHLLGVQIVLVVGVRNQLDEKLMKVGVHPTYVNGVRVTDDLTLSLLKEASGSARFEIETALSRGFRGLPGQRGINCVSGNFFYSAKPFGVRAGVDYKLTGEVRKIESENIKRRLEFGDIVMLSSLGYSLSGEVFSIQSENLASECAIALDANKIIYLTNGECLMDSRTIPMKPVQSLRLNQAISLLKIYSHLLPSNEISNVTTGSYPQSMPSLSSVECDNDPKVIANYLRVIHRSVDALSAGVKRAHLLAPTAGAILKELYTRDGAGMLIARDIYEGIRPALPSDLRELEKLLEPLVQAGILVPRSKDQLEKDLSDTFLLTRDGTVLGCGMLKRFTSDCAEIACLVVNPAFRRSGRGETMLAYLERRAVLMGISSVFVLSTHTMLWFEERGFVNSDPSLLPANRFYNVSRGSKVYIKQLGTQRDVDAEELLWNV